MARAQAEPIANPEAGFSQTLAADVFGTALAFMAPRTLEPIPIPQLTIWGLRGLTAIDPQLAPDLRGPDLVLLRENRVVARVAVPPAEDAQDWGSAAASLAAAAWDGSGPLQRGGTPGVIRSFFDELFNHLDPYSRYEPPGAAAADRDRRSGEGGVGISLMTHGTAILVQSVIADGPAAAAGIRPGERLLAIGGRRLPSRSPTAAAALIAGPEATKVTITLRSRDGRVRRVEMVRALVPPETVFAEAESDMLVLRITGFSRSTGRRVAHEIVQGVAGPRHPRGVVLDLRGNRGGLLRQAVAATETLLGSGPVATTAGRDPEADHDWQAHGTDLSGGLPVVVLVDGRSASAAEIVAASLGDNGRAVVVGSATLGKGLVQTISPLPDGGALFVTWSRVLAPLGWPIQGLGVLPQVCTSLGQDALERQLASLGQGRQPMQRVLTLHREARAPMPVAQILDIRNACPAAVGSDRDLQAAQMLIDTPEAYGTALTAPTQLHRSAGRE